MIDGRSDILLQEQRFGSARLRRLNAATAASVWDIPLEAHAPPAGLSAAQLPQWSRCVEQWTDVRFSRSTQLVHPTPDLDGDGTTDR